MEGNTGNAIGVKLTYDGQMRRFPFSGASYAVFYEQIVALLGLDETADITIKYIDEEGDQITISSDLELKSAVVPGQLLRVTVLPNKRSIVEPVPIVTQAPPQAQPLEPSQFFNHPSAQHFQQHAPPAFPGAAPFHPPPPGFGPGPQFGRGPGPHFGPGGDFGAFKHGCGGGEKWAKNMEKHGRMMEKMHKKTYKKMAKEGLSMGPHHHPHHPHPYPPHMGGWHSHKRECGSKGDKLTARFVSDVTVQDGTTLLPGTPFMKTWRIRNEGPVWPAGCGLLFISRKSHDLHAPAFVPVTETVPTGGEVDLSVNLVAPEKSGRYTGYWRLCTADGKKFGQRVWASFVVSTSPNNSSEEEREADKYEALVDVVLRNETFRSLGIKRHWVFRLLQKCDGDVDRVQAILTKKAEKKLIKASKKH